MDALIAECLAEANTAGNSYLQALADGALCREDFVATQVQFFHAVTVFGRPMAALAARLPTPEARAVIFRNVWEEHGEGDMSQTHTATFLAFLSELGGLEPEAIWSIPLWPEVRGFNNAVIGTALADDVMVGICTLGMIERLFADISAMIARSVVDRGWLPPEQLVHYDLHAHLDIRHAEDFFGLARPHWPDGERRYEIAQGLRLGANLFMDLYEGLWRARGRRWSGRPPTRRH